MRVHEQPGQEGKSRAVTGGLLSAFLRFFLEHKPVTFLLLAGVVLWGIAVAPFDWDVGRFPRRPVPVDAIPNLGENQQIVFTEWPGRSPQDVDDQVTYPLTVSLMGVPGVQEVRSTSMFGLSLIFLIFDEDIDFYWARTRILEKLSGLPAGGLPEEARPSLGPDATALGQVYWYTLEGRDPDGRVTGGWDLHELRSAQDWLVRYALLAAEGVSEVASIGGYVREYQVDVDPHALRAHGVALDQVVEAVRKSNLDVGARVTEINRVEYVVRGLGFVRTLSDLEQAVVRAGPDGLPIRVRDVATVGFGPAQRRGALTKMGAEAVGGVVVVREGYNPLRAIQNVKQQIEEIRSGLPVRPVVDWDRVDRAGLAAFAEAQGLPAFSGTELNRDAWADWLHRHPREQWPDGITLSQLEIVPFYDRTGLINETLATLNDALVEEALIVVAVILLAVMHLPSAAIVSSLLPLAILICFIGMKLFGVDSHLVSMAGIAIAIGTIADMGIIISENIRRHLRSASSDVARREAVFRGAQEVAPAMLTAMLSTVIGFLPVFTMTGAEGKMFTPLAYTWTMVLISSVLVALTLVPALMHLAAGGDSGTVRRTVRLVLAAAGMLLGAWLGRGIWVAAGAALFLVPRAWKTLGSRLVPGRLQAWFARANNPSSRAARVVIGLGNGVAILAVAVLLSRLWEPLGSARGAVRNFFFVGILIAGVMLILFVILRAYRLLLRRALAHKRVFLALPVSMLVLGVTIWFGFVRVFGIVPAAAERAGLNGDALRATRPWVWATHAFPGLGREFVPALDEGSFLWMPTTLPHASIGEVLEVMQYQDLAMASVPEVDLVVGKLGRAESALDPAPVSMIETIIHYKPEFKLDKAGRRIRFRYDRSAGVFARDAAGELIPDRRGRPFRQWRDHIRTPDDIWDEIVRVAEIPGTTSAPKLQPIETRLVMLQTGMRAPMGIKLRAPDLETLDRMAVEIEGHLREAPGVRPETVNADRVVGKPYLEIDIDRAAVARHGLNVYDVQRTLAAAIGGMTVTTTVEGRERYPVRIRYARELRDGIERMERVGVATADGGEIPLGALADVRYARGPQMIRSEDTFLTAYITFGAQRGLAEVDVVEGARDYLDALVAEGEWRIPPGVHWRFAGSYEHQLRFIATLWVVLPLALGLIFLVLYFQFRRLDVAAVIFSSVAVAWAGGFVMLYMFGLEGFLDLSVFGVNLRDLFQLHAVHLSVAVWVGFLALFGIAVDDGVVLATYMRQRIEAQRPRTRRAVRAAVLAAGQRRIRPCLMTSATTFLALLPVLTSTGRGSDLLIPMALPIVGGITLGIIDWFTVPVLLSAVEERRLARRKRGRPEAVHKRER